MDMFPPGRIVFIRPLKQLDEQGRKKGPKQWDTVWVQPTEIISEGILVSPRVSALPHALVHLSMPVLDLEQVSIPYL